MARVSSLGGSRLSYYLVLPTAVRIATADCLPSTHLSHPDSFRYSPMADVGKGTLTFKHVPSFARLVMADSRRSAFEAAIDDSGRSSAAV